MDLGTDRLQTPRRVVSTDLTVHQPLSQAPPPRAKLLPWILIALGCVVLAVLVVKTLVHVRQTDQVKARALRGPIPIEAAPARVASIEEVVGGSGQIEQYTTLTVFSKLGTRITELPVFLGAFVKTGDLLAKLDDRVQHAAIVANRALVETNKVKAKDYESAFNRLTALHERKMAADYDVETAEISYMTAKQAVASAEQTLVQAEVELEYTVLKSPVNGIVIERPANLGELAIANAEVLKLGEIDDVYLNAKIAEEQVGSVRVHMGAEASFDAYPGEVFTGSVEKIDPKTNASTHSFSVYVKIPNPGWRLLPGLNGFARLKQSRRVLTVPNTAVLNPVGDHASVFVIDSQHHAHERSVRVGVMSGALTEILFGLQEGDLIAVAGQLYLAENDEVRINPASARR